MQYMVIIHYRCSMKLANHVYGFPPILLKKGACNSHGSSANGGSTFSLMNKYCSSGADLTKCICVGKWQERILCREKNLQQLWVSIRWTGLGIFSTICQLVAAKLGKTAKSLGRNRIP